MQNNLLLIKKIINKKELQHADIEEIKSILDKTIKIKTNKLVEPQLLKPKDITKKGKYWGLKFGAWNKVVVCKLPINGTGAYKYSPVKKNDNYARIGLSNCELFYGPVKSWKNTNPDFSHKQLINAGASKFWLSEQTGCCFGWNPEF